MRDADEDVDGDDWEALERHHGENVTFTLAEFFSATRTLTNICKQSVVHDDTHTLSVLTGWLKRPPLKCTGMTILLAVHDHAEIETHPEHRVQAMTGILRTVQQSQDLCQQPHETIHIYKDRIQRIFVSLEEQFVLACPNIDIQQYRNTIGIQAPHPELYMLTLARHKLSTTWLTKEYRNKRKHHMTFDFETFSKLKSMTEELDWLCEHMRRAGEMPAGLQSSIVESLGISQERTVGATTQAESKTKVCRNYPLGKCRYGDKCRYQHVDGTRTDTETRPETESNKEVCRNYQLGRCKYGNKCRNLHVDGQRGRTGTNSGNSNSGNSNRVHNKTHGGRQVNQPEDRDIAKAVTQLTKANTQLTKVLAASHIAPQSTTTPRQPSAATRPPQPQPMPASSATDASTQFADISITERAILAAHQQQVRDHQWMGVSHTECMESISERCDREMKRRQG